MKELIEVLKNNGYLGKEKIEEKELKVPNLTFTKLRDNLFKLGKIIEEDKINKIYVVKIRAGKFGNDVIIAMKLIESKLFLFGYSKQGIIKTNSVQKVFSQIESTLLNKEVLCKKSLKNHILVICIVLFFLIGFIIIYSINGIINATEDYNNEVIKYNYTVKEYNDLATRGELKTINDMPSKMETLDVQDTDMLSALCVIFSSNSKAKIEKDTTTIKNMIKDNTNAITIAKQVIHPKQDFICDRIKKVKSITGIESVSEKNDPNGLLNKKGGYYGCLYFSIKSIDDNKVSGDGIVEKGTDVGGAIELYDDVNKAKERCKYLASFDGTILSTGSYVLVGTMIIRTSYKLDDLEQYQLTDSIIKELTAIQ